MRKKVSVRQKEMAKKAPLAKKPATKWELDEQCLNQHLGRASTAPGPRR